jgi:hypothetical protein
MKKLSMTYMWVTVVLILVGCSSHRPLMPTMDLPLEPTKPAIKSSVIVQNSIPYISYTVPDSLRLYQYLLEQDAYAEKLAYRVKAMNQLWQGEK